MRDEYDFSNAQPHHQPASGVAIGPRLIYVNLADGRRYQVPRKYTPKLAAATTKQLANWRFIPGLEGPVGVHWPDLDEDIFIGVLGDFLQT